MRADIEITRDGELMVAHIEGLTPAGEEFVDAYFPKDGRDIVSVDAGRIVIPFDEEPALAAAAAERGLKVAR